MKMLFVALLVSAASLSAAISVTGVDVGFRPLIFLIRITKNTFPAQQWWNQATEGSPTW